MKKRSFSILFSSTRHNPDLSYPDRIRNELQKILVTRRTWELGHRGRGRVVESSSALVVSVLSYSSAYIARGSVWNCKSYLGIIQALVYGQAEADPSQLARQRELASLQTASLISNASYSLLHFAHRTSLSRRFETILQPWKVVSQCFVAFLVVPCRSTPQDIHYYIRIFALDFKKLQAEPKKSSLTDCLRFKYYFLANGPYFQAASKKKRPATNRRPMPGWAARMDI